MKYPSISNDQEKKKRLVMYKLLSQMHVLDAEAKQKLSAVKGCLSSSAVIALEWSSHSFSQPITVLNYKLHAVSVTNANVNCSLHVKCRNSVTANLLVVTLYCYFSHTTFF